MELLDLLAIERRGLADVLDALDDEQWATPSLAEGWTVRHVVAHLVMPFRYSVPRVALRLLKAGGNFNRMADQVARRDALLATAELVGILRRNADNRFTPPGAGYEAPLTDLIVHGLDICRPLMIERTLPIVTGRVVLNHVVTARSLKFFGIDVGGVHLQATDLDWTFGSGAAVAGPAADLILMLCGRPAGADRLTGAGLRLLVGS